MTGDNHGDGGMAPAVRHLPQQSPARLLGGRLGVRARHRLPLRGRRFPDTPAARSTTTSASRSRSTSTPTAPTSLRRRSRTIYADQLADVRLRTYPEHPAPDDQPQPLHRRGATGPPWPRSRSRTASGSTPTTTTGRRAGSRNRPGMFTGSGMPMRFAELDGTMIDCYQAATQMTDESGESLPVHHRRAARQGARARGLLRRLHHQHALRLVTARRLGRDRGLGAGARRAGGLGAGRCCTGSTAATARRSGTWPGAAAQLSFTIRRARARATCEAMLPVTAGVGESDRDHARPGRRSRTRPDHQGHRVRVLPGRRRAPTSRSTWWTRRRR